jgi:hypothetical protein
MKFGKLEVEKSLVYKMRKVSSYAKGCPEHIPACTKIEVKTYSRPSTGVDQALKRNKSE